MRDIRKKKTGLFFGSFNPIHIGHLVIANYFVEYSDLGQVWFVISPQNPFKKKATLLDDHHRLMLVKTAVEDDFRFKAEDIEFKMPKPSYTIDTLTYLSEKHPDKPFVLIAGTDILPSFHKWKNYREILKQYELYIYNRPGTDPGKYEKHPKLKFFDAPRMEISASFIRRSIKEGRDMRYMLPGKVYEYIKEMHFYER